MVKSSYTKLIKAIHTSQTNTTTVAGIFLKHRVTNVDIPLKLPTENGPQFVLKILRSLCSTPVLNRIVTAESYTQTSGHVEGVYSTDVTRLHYFSAQAPDRPGYLPPNTDARLHQTSTQVFQGVFIQSCVYMSNPCAGKLCARIPVTRVEWRNRLALGRKIGTHTASEKPTQESRRKLENGAKDL